MYVDKSHAENPLERVVCGLIDVNGVSSVRNRRRLKREPPGRGYQATPLKRGFRRCILALLASAKPHLWGVVT